MPFITATHNRQNGETYVEGAAIVRDLLEQEKERYNDAAVFADQGEWLEDGPLITANLPYKIKAGETLVVAEIEPEIEPEPEPEPEPEATFTSAPISWLKNQLTSDPEPEPEEEPVAEVVEEPVVEPEPVPEEDVPVDPEPEPVAEVDPDTETCQALKGDGDLCLRELPCQYHPGE